MNNFEKNQSTKYCIPDIPAKVSFSQSCGSTTRTRKRAGEARILPRPQEQREDKVSR